MGVSGLGDLAGGSFLGDPSPVGLRGGVEAWGPQGGVARSPPWAPGWHPPQPLSGGSHEEDPESAVPPLGVTPWSGLIFLQTLHA